MKQIVPIQQTAIVKDCDENTVTDSLAVMIAKIIQLSGQRSQASDIAVYARAMTAEIKNNYRFLSLDEINFAFERGTMGEYGEYMGINVVSMTRWLKSYSKSEQRQRVFDQRKPKEITAHQHPSEAQRFDISISGLRRKFSEYQSTGMLYDPGNASFFFLERQGLICLDNEQKAVIFELAKCALLTQAQQQRRGKNKVEAMNAGDLIDKITKSEKSSQDLIKIEARRIALQNFFDEVIKTGGNIDEVIMAIKKPETCQI